MRAGRPGSACGEDKRVTAPGTQTCVIQGLSGDSACKEMPSCRVAFRATISLVTLDRPAAKPKAWSSASRLEGAQQAVLGGIQRRSGAAGYPEL